MGDLNITLGAWNNFSGKCGESCDCFFSEIKIFEYSAFGHVTEVPINKIDEIVNKYNDTYHRITKMKLVDVKSNTCIH